MDELTLVGVAFNHAGKIFDFDAHGLTLSPGDKVIVETERGRALGTIVRGPRQIAAEDAPPKLKTIMRQATDNDLQMAASNRAREAEALQYCQQRISERRMEMKLVRAEHLFDGSKIIFYFTADGRVDFRELVRDLAQHFRTRIEMRQIGVRDEAKLVGGLGICGRELCCCSYLRDFAPVSVKMAKAQGLALNPSKISGQCGRLLCCLAYEYENYRELIKNLPKCGKKLTFSETTAEVVNRDILAQKVTLACANGERCQYHIDELNARLEAKPASSHDSPSSAPPTAAKSGNRNRSAAAANRSKTKTHSEQTPRPEQTGAAAQPEPPEGNDGSKKKPSRRRRRPRRRSKNKNPNPDS